MHPHSQNQYRTSPNASQRSLNTHFNQFNSNHPNYHHPPPCQPFFDPSVRPDLNQPFINPKYKNQQQYTQQYESQRSIQSSKQINPASSLQIKNPTLQAHLSPSRERQIQSQQDIINEKLQQEYVQNQKLKQQLEIQQAQYLQQQKLKQQQQPLQQQYMQNQAPSSPKNIQQARPLEQIPKRISNPQYAEPPSKFQGFSDELNNSFLQKSYNTNQEVTFSTQIPRQISSQREIQQKQQLTQEQFQVMQQEQQYKQKTLQDCNTRQNIEKQSQLSQLNSSIPVQLQHPKNAQIYSQGYQQSPGQEQVFGNQIVQNTNISEQKQQTIQRMQQQIPSQNQNSSQQIYLQTNSSKQQFQIQENIQQQSEGQQGAQTINKYKQDQQQFNQKQHQQQFQYQNQEGTQEGNQQIYHSQRQLQYGKQQQYQSRQGLQEQQNEEIQINQNSFKEKSPSKKYPDVQRISLTQQELDNLNGSLIVQQLIKSKEQNNNLRIKLLNLQNKIQNENPDILKMQTLEEKIKSTIFKNDEIQQENKKYQIILVEENTIQKNDELGIKLNNLDVLIEQEQQKIEDIEKSNNSFQNEIEGMQQQIRKYENDQYDSVTIQSLVKELELQLKQLIIENNRLKNVIERQQMDDSIKILKENKSQLLRQMEVDELELKQLNRQVEYIGNVRQEELMFRIENLNYEKCQLQELLNQKQENSRQLERLKQKMEKLQEENEELMVN